MSYGFYRMSRTATRADYVEKVARVHNVVIAIGIDVSNPSPRIVEVVDDFQIVEPPHMADTLLSDVRAQGYSGDLCTTCQGARMRWAGHCQVCEDCGTTTGCS